MARFTRSSSSILTSSTHQLKEPFFPLPLALHRDREHVVDLEEQGQLISRDVEVVGIGEIELPSAAGEPGLLSPDIDVLE